MWPYIDNFHTFQVTVDPAGIRFVRDKYIPPNDPVFELVPSSFSIMVNRFYDDLGRPPITRTTIWDVYNDLLSMFRQLKNIPYIPEWEMAVSLARAERPEDAVARNFDLFPDLEELRDGDNGNYLGSVNGGLGLGK